MLLRCVTAKHAASTVEAVDAACLAVTWHRTIHHLATDILAAFEEMFTLDSFEETTCTMQVPTPASGKLDGCTVIAPSIFMPLGGNSWMSLQYAAIIHALHTQIVCLCCPSAAP